MHPHTYKPTFGFVISVAAERLVIVTDSTKWTKAGFAKAVISIELETI